MNKKGFTIIELLAVIVILGLVMVIAIPTILNTRNAIMGELSSQQKKNLQESAKLFAVDLDDPYSDVFNCKGWLSGRCSKGWTTVNVTVYELSQHGYFEDNQKKCGVNGNVKITKKSDGSGYDVDVANVTCN